MYNDGSAVLLLSVALVQKLRMVRSFLQNWTSVRLYIVPTGESKRVAVAPPKYLPLAVDSIAVSLFTVRE